MSVRHDVSLTTTARLNEGDWFEWKANWQARPALIDSVHVTLSGSIELAGFALKKDGTPGKAHQSSGCHSWDPAPSVVVAQIVEEHQRLRTIAQAAVDCETGEDE
jgi:hypothetical protein